MHPAGMDLTALGLSHRQFEPFAGPLVDKMMEYRGKYMDLLQKEENRKT